MKNTMKAMVLEEFGKPLILKELPIPEPETKQVRIKVKANGICATDLKIKSGKFPAKLPLIMGHEVAGIVDKLGDGCNHFKKGDKVVLRARDTCGKCHYCKQNLEFLCENINGVLGSTLNGGYAEYTVVPEKLLVKIPDGLPFDKAAVTTDSVATSYNALVNKISIKPGDSILIMGVGGLGMNAVQIAKALGAVVIAADLNDAKLELAKKVGADYIFNTENVDLVEKCKEVTNGYGVNWSAEFAGKTASTELALKCLAVGGTQVQPGYSMTDSFTDSLYDFVGRDLKLIASRSAAPDTLESAMRMVCEGKVDPQIDPNYIIKLEQINELHEALEDGKVNGRAVIIYD